MACWCGIRICCAVCRLQVCSRCCVFFWCRGSSSDDVTTSSFRIPSVSFRHSTLYSLIYWQRRWVNNKKGASFWVMTPALLSNQFRRFEESQCLHFEESRVLGSLDARLCDATGLSHKISAASFCPPLATRQNLTSCRVIHSPAGYRILRNVGTSQPNYTASQHRKAQSYL